MYIDFPQQKVTIIGWADPEKIVKAIKKTRKVATICAHIEPTDQAAQPSEQAPAEAGTPEPDTVNPPPTEASPSPPAEPPKDPPPPENPLPPENPPPPETKPSPMATDTNAGKPTGPSSRPTDVEEVHVIYHHPPDYRYRYGYSHAYGGHGNNYHNGQGSRNEPPPPPIYATHNYNTYRPSPYVTEYEYVRSPPQYTHYSRMDHYSEDYHSSSIRNNNGNITSIFSDENPNACRIV